MKIGNTGYPQAYGVGAPAAAPQVSRDEKTRRASAASAALKSDEATLMGIPAGELTPKVRAAIDQLLSEVQNLRVELDQARRRIDHLEQLADQDPLAPVLNRRAFVREMSRLMAFAERYGSTSAVLYFDVNGLKTINDSMGHAAGDAAIAHVAEVLLAHVRGSDVVGRLGGDEFGVILAQAEVSEAETKAQSLAEAIAESPALWNGQPLRVGVAYGAHSLSHGQEALEALDAADRAMYEQKRSRARTAEG